MAVPQLDPAKLQLVQELEIEMMSDMYNRLVSACHRKCIPVKYHEPELGTLQSLQGHSLNKKYFPANACGFACGKICLSYETIHFSRIKSRNSIQTTFY